MTEEEEEDIPVLDDLIEKGIEITLSDLGFDDEPALSVDDVLEAEAELEIAEDDAAPIIAGPQAAEPSTPDPQTVALQAVETYSAQLIAAAGSQADPLADNPALEQEIRRILDEHMELAWQEIRIAIQQHLDHS